MIAVASVCQSSRPRFAPFIAVLVAVAAAQILTAVGFGLVAPGPIARFIVGVAGVIAAVLAAAWAARPMGRGVLGVVAVAVAALAVLAWIGPSIASWAAAIAVTAALLAGGALGGASLGQRVEAPGHLAVLAYVCALADLVSVLTPSGPSARIAASETLLHVLAVPWTIGQGGEALPILGVADVVMTGFFVAAARRHQLSMRRTLVALTLGYVATFALLAVVARPLPALPALGLAMVIAHPEARRVPPADRRVAWVASAVLTVAFAAFAAYGWWHAA